MITSLLLSALLVTTPQMGAVQAAIDHYISVGCSSEMGDYAIGTAFPISDHYAMTAGHVQCLPNETMSVSADGWATWIDIDSDHYFLRTDFDVMVIDTQDYPIPPPVQFRAGILGEPVASYGTPFNGLLTTGLVASLPDFEHIVTTSIPFPGMSGSAIFTDDGFVVGMTDLALQSGDIPATVDGGISGPMLQLLVDSFEDHINEPLSPAQTR